MNRSRTSRETTRNRNLGACRERRQQRDTNSYASSPRRQLPSPDFLVEPQPRDSSVERGYN